MRNNKKHFLMIDEIKMQWKTNARSRKRKNDKTIANDNISYNWAQQSIHEAKNMIKNILNEMKKEIKSSIKSSIFNVNRNIINIKTVNQISFVTKTINVERVLFDQKLRRDNVTISCQLISQIIKIERRVQYQED